MKKSDIHLKDIIHINNKFSRSINIKLESNNDDLFDIFIPNNKLVKVFSNIFNSIKSNRNKIRVLTGAYGSGKSLFASILSIILKNNSDDTKRIDFLQKIINQYKELSKPIENYLINSNKLYPLIISGFTGDLKSVFLNAIEEVANKENIRVNTIFQKVKSIIALWEDNYKDTFSRFIDLVTKKFSDYKREIEICNEEFLLYFESIYKQLTSGADLILYKDIDVVNSLKELNDKLCLKGYNGIFIIYDEFGQFLNKAIENPLLLDFSLLQDIAEYCEKSEENRQMHLTMITHKSISNYLLNIDDTIAIKWKAIEGRFEQIDINSDPDNLFHIMNNVIEKKDNKLFEEYLREFNEEFNFLLNNIPSISNLFPLRLTEDILKKIFPLHPVTSVLLPRLSLMFGQNERTIFSFLSIDEQNSLTNFIKSYDNGFELLTPDVLYDYFVNEIMCDVGPNGKHKIVLLADNAIKNLKMNDVDLEKIIKIIALFQILELPNLTIDFNTIIYSLFSKNINDFEKTIIKKIKYLIKEKIIVERDSNLKIVNKTNFNIEEELHYVSASINLKSTNINRLVNEFISSQYYIPKEYNAIKKMTRFFKTYFTTSAELGKNINDKNILIDKDVFLDGIVILCLSLEISDIEKFYQIAKECNNKQIFFIIPKKIIQIKKHIIELEALKIIKEDDNIHKNDISIIEDINYFIDNTIEEIKSILNIYTDFNSVDIYTNGGKLLIDNNREFNTFLSDICDKLFSNSFTVNIEVFNKNRLTKVQERALLSVLDVILKNDEYNKEQIKGGGPDDLIFYNTIITNNIRFVDDMPMIDNGINKKSFDNIKTFFDDFFNTEDYTFTNLIEKLLQKPFGLRKPVITILLILFFKKKLNSLTFYKNGILIEDYTPQFFLDILNNYKEYLVEKFKKNEKLQELITVIEELFSDFIYNNEKDYSLRYLRTALIRYYQSIPKITRDSSDIDKDARNFLSTIKDSAISDAKLFNVELFKLINDNVIKNLFYNIRNNIDLYFDNVYNRITQMIFMKLDIKGESNNLIDKLNNFYASINNEVYKTKFNFDFINNFLSLKNEINILNYKSLCNKIGYIFTGIQVFDWTESSFFEFEKNLDLLVSVLKVDKGISNKLEKIKVSLSFGNNTLEKHIEDIELSQLATQLLTTLENRISRYGTAITPNEKSKICIELLKRMIDG